ncbi:GNAT family N-acetyltransferase [Promicromonospora sp. NPDC019610]|uniref:GNAT family N-acetyltransferase n=1 Tax=Promicromonospora sp. NPDC019610 TaxID=3364405 RepID=UPI0037947E4B
MTGRSGGADPGATDPVGTDPVVADAVRASDVAARAAGVEIRMVDDMAGHTAAERLWTEVWGSSPVPAELLRVLAKTTNYVAAAYVGDRMVGACVGFFHAPEERALHSHVAGVSAGSVGRGIGFALKLHQRAWVLQQGADAITWTYDPLVARNAHLNLVKLAARAVEYLPGFYGAMPDAINRGDESDRILVRWDLRDPRVAAACSGDGPSPGAAGPAGAAGPGGAAAPGGLVTVPVPADIETLRTTDPAAARRWRVAVREGLLPALSGGGSVVGFGPGGYLVHVPADLQADPPTVTDPPTGPPADPSTDKGTA